MDTNSNEKKPKRPRIGQNYNSIEPQADRPRFERPAFQTSGHDDNENGDFQQHRQYSPRTNNYQQRQQGYNNRQGGYNNNNRYNNGYQQRNHYQQRPQHNDYTPAEVPFSQNDSENAETTTNNNSYTPRQNNYNNGGYNNRQGGSYNNRQNGGYNNNRQGGYNNNRQGNYNNNRQGGYNNRQNGSYNNNNNRQGGGYNNRQNGGYNNNRQGNYNNNNNRRYQQQNNNGFPGRGKSFIPRPKRIEYEMPIPDPNEQIRLNKFMSNAGICSRREADEFITQGLVKVNGQVVTELGTKINHNDVVEYDEKVVTMQSKCYILLNKPKDCVTTSDDPNGRMTVMDLVKGACPERIYPVGRLDRNTTGVLLLTNDGDLASKLTHPKYVKKKIYHVWCDRDISEDDMQSIADGIELEDGPIHADAISYATETDRNQAGIEIHSGRNRIVRRIFESLGYHVTKLDRVYFAGLTKKNLPRGRWRYLTQEEVNYLKMGSFE